MLSGATNSPVLIKDIIVIATSLDDRNPVGEFRHSSVPDETPSKTIERLYSYIEKLVHFASLKHRNRYCAGTNNLAPGKENCITRLVSNEFFFYTNKELTIEQFQELQQKIADLAASHPKNLHLILSSFAVKTPDDKIMNVTPHIECGLDPKINFIVKNSASTIDPTYSEFDMDSGLIKLFPNVKIETDDISNLSISLNSKPHFFSYNNVIKCELPFYTCVDICLDHANGVAKKNINNLLNSAIHTAIINAAPGQQITPLQAQCSHVVTSNVIRRNG